MATVEKQPSQTPRPPSPIFFARRCRIRKKRAYICTSNCCTKCRNKPRNPSGRGCGTITLKSIRHDYDRCRLYGHCGAPSPPCTTAQPPADHSLLLLDRAMPPPRRRCAEDSVRPRIFRRGAHRGQCSFAGVRLPRGAAPPAPLAAGVATALSQLRLAVKIPPKYEQQPKINLLLLWMQRGLPKLLPSLYRADSSAL